MTKGQERVDRFFDLSSGFWESVYDEQSLEGNIYRSRLEAVLSEVDRLRLSPQSRVLEIGCGAGLLALKLADRNLQVHAVDSSPRMLELASRRLASFEQDQRPILALADASDLPYAAAAFDLVLAVGVMPWAPRPEDVVREMARVLRPQGTAIITFDNRLRLNFLLDPRFHPLLRRTKRFVRRSLERAGLLAPGADLDGTFHSYAEAASLLATAGLVCVDHRTLGFGPFTLFGRSLIPDRLGRLINHRLSSPSRQRLPVIRSTGTQLLILARKE